MCVAVRGGSCEWQLTPFPQPPTRRLSNDVPNDPENPHPGALYNAPTTAAQVPEDVYPGCVTPRSYTAADVTAANFLAVITGNASNATGAVLESGPHDKVGSGGGGAWQEAAVNTTRPPLPHPIPRCS